jgi:hypothetical protein
LKTLFPLLAALALFIASPAQAEDSWYTRGGALATSGFDMKDLGGEVEVGHQWEYVALGMMARNHCHLGDCTPALGINVYGYPFSVGIFDPYLVAGVGIARRGTTHSLIELRGEELVESLFSKDEYQPYVNGGFGVEANIMPWLALYAEWKAIAYRDNVRELLDVADYNRSWDDVIGAGVKVSF